MNLVIKYIFIFLILINNSYSKDINLGMSADFSGPISYLGSDMKKGILTYFNKINKTSKHKFKLIAYDDKYNPVIASYNVKKLIYEDNVLSLIGNVGTPTANVVIPIINENKIPFFGAYSGGDILRQSQNNEYVFNYRASYSQESNKIVSSLLKKGINPKDIAVFSQNDTYGDSGFQGVLNAYRDFGLDLKDIAHERYTTGTINIENGLSKLLDWERDFKFIIIVGVNKATTKFIKYAKEDFPNAKFFVLSPVNLEEISLDLQKFRTDIFSTQVVPTLFENSLKISDEFIKDFNLFYPNDEYSLTSFEGYIIAKLFIESLKGLDLESITSKDIYKRLKMIDNLDIGLGFSSNFSNKLHQYSSKVWLTKINTEKKLINLNWDEILK